MRKRSENLQRIQEETQQSKKSFKILQEEQAKKLHYSEFSDPAKALGK